MSNNKDFKVKNGIQPTVYHEGLGTVTSGGVGWGLGAASYDGVSFSVTAQDTVPTSVFFKPEGDKMYILGRTGDRVYEYDLSTAWDVSTASYFQNQSISAQESNPFGLFFKPDGTKMYVSGYAGDDINEYDLSTAWDVRSSTFNSATGIEASQITGLFFKPDGTKMYFSDVIGGVVYEVELSTAWDVSTRSGSSQSFDVSAQETQPTGVSFKPDGTKMYIIGYIGDDVNEYDLSTAWDVTSASFVQAFSVAAQETAPNGLFFKPDGTKMFVVGQTSDTVYQYSTVLTTNALDLSTGSVFEVTPTSDVQVTLSNPAASGTVSGATLLLDGGPSVAYDISNAVYDSKSFNVSSENVQVNGVAFSNSGTKMFIAGGSAPDTVFQYSLSSAWDVSTSSYDSVSLDVSGQTGTGLNDLTFNNDGTKMYVCSNTPDVVYQYSLTTPFDLSTASYDSVSASVSEAASPQALCFSSDGLKLLVADTGSNRVEPYTLTTPFDISSVSYDGDFLNVNPQDTNLHGIAINEDGSKVFVLGRENSSVYEYTLTTPNDVTTGTYSGNSFSVVSEEVLVAGLFFGRGATKMYVSGNTNDSVFQYTVGSEATITYDTAIEWPSGTAPTSPAIGETDVVTFNTRDGGSTYQGVLAIDGAK